MDLKKHHIWKPQKKHKTWWFLWNTTGDISWDMSHMSPSISNLVLSTKRVPPNPSVHHHYPHYLMAIWYNYPIFKHTHLESWANHPWFGRSWKICLNKSSSQFHQGFDGYAREIHRWYILSAFCKKNITCNSWLMEPITSGLQQHLSFFWYCWHILHSNEHFQAR